MHPSCNEFVVSGYCDKHKITYEKKKPEMHNMYNNQRWRNYRLQFLSKHPLCVECERQGKLIPGVVVDHIVPHKGDYQLFWDSNNHQTLCIYHHNQKTIKESGNWGNR